MKPAHVCLVCLTSFSAAMYGAVTYAPAKCNHVNEHEVTIRVPELHGNPWCNIGTLQALGMEDLQHEQQRYQPNMTVTDSVVGTANVTLSGVQGTLHRL